MYNIHHDIIQEILIIGFDPPLAISIKTYF